MISAQHSLEISAGIDHVWDYVQDIRRWANLFPGCQDCEIIDDNDSRWTLKVGAGGMVKTVSVLVHVEEWAGPNRVAFSFELATEPVVGRGSYTATADGDRATEVALQVEVTGSGSMAPMWEAMSKPLLPQMAEHFADSLRAEIEGTEQPRLSLANMITAWFRSLWRALRGRRENA